MEQTELLELVKLFPMVCWPIVVLWRLLLPFKHLHFGPYEPPPPDPTAHEAYDACLGCCCYWLFSLAVLVLVAVVRIRTDR